LGIRYGTRGKKKREMRTHRLHLVHGMENSGEEGGENLVNHMLLGRKGDL